MNHILCKFEKFEAISLLLFYSEAILVSRYVAKLVLCDTSIQTA